MSKFGRLSTKEIDSIKSLLKQGIPIWKISIITERSEYSIQNIRKEMLREVQDPEPEPEPEEKQEKPDGNHIKGDMKAWLKENWHWKKPKPPVKKRASNFRTPYHYPGKPLH